MHVSEFIGAAPIFLSVPGPDMIAVAWTPDRYPGGRARRDTTTRFCLSSVLW